MRLRVEVLAAVLMAVMAMLLAGCGGCGPSGEDTAPVGTATPAGDQCQTCHVGIETAHTPIDSGDCTICHGGDGQGTTKAAAHVAIPADYWDIRGDGLPFAPDGFIKDFAPDQLDQLDPAYVRFINPGDIRAVDETCGTCHPAQAANVKNSIMTTNAGHYMPTLYMAGFQDQKALYGAHPATDPDCAPEDHPGSVCEVTTLVPDDDASLDAAVAAGDHDALEEMAYNHYLAKSCNTCHAAGYPRNNSGALYRSTGCTACHVLYNQDGVYKGHDEATPKNVPVYPNEHRITSAIPTEQCATCHFQGGRIGLLYRGIREGGFSTTPENAELWNESVYGHTAGYYVLDEDTTNDVDETPPDVHYSAGMHCSDCHIGSDVHGDGRIYSTAKQQVDLRCEDCHGTVRQRAVPDAAGLYRTQGGRVLTQLSTNEQGDVVLTGRVDGAVHVTPQPADLLAGDSASARMHQAMAPDDDDWSHTDALTCDACHTSYNQYCVGCHVSMDMRLSQIDYQTGTKTTGLVRGSRDTLELDQVLLGIAPSGRVQRVIPSQQVQMQVYDRDGELWVGAEGTDGDQGAFRSTATSDANIGMAPFFQHTTTAKPGGCSMCHRTGDSPEEWARVKGVYGFGTGEHMIANPFGPPVDALQMLAEDGTQLTDWMHVGTGPVPEEQRNRALDVVVDE